MAKRLTRTRAFLEKVLPPKRQWDLTFRLRQRPCPSSKVVVNFHQTWFSVAPDKPCPYCKAQL